MARKSDEAARWSHSSGIAAPSKWIAELEKLNRAIAENDEELLSLRFEQASRLRGATDRNFDVLRKRVRELENMLVVSRLAEARALKAQRLSEEREEATQKRRHRLDMVALIASVVGVTGLALAVLLSFAPWLGALR